MKQFCWLACCLSLGSIPPNSAGARELKYDYESAETSWQLADADGSARLLVHERDFATAHSGKASEHLRVWAAQATQVHLAHPVEPAAVIEELVPSLWVKSDRPGLRLLVRVVLPRSTDDRGNPLVVLLDGDSYTQVSTWQQLQLRDIKRRLVAEVQRRRLQFDRVDERQAYVDHVVVNAYGGEGVTNLWLDDLVMIGHASSTPVATSNIRPPLPPRPDIVASAELRPTDVRSELQGTVLLVDGRPFFPLIIEHSGEPFLRLKQLGFNTVRLRQPPTTAQLSEARQSQVWLISPPPAPEGDGKLTAAHERVLAWLLPGSAVADDASLRGDVAAQLHLQEPRAPRPIVYEAQPGRAFPDSTADMLLLGRPVVGTSFELRELCSWLEQAARSTGGKPFWGAVETEPADALLQQLALGRTAVGKLSVECEQMRLMAFENLAAGARGLLFRSRSRLDLEDEPTRLRAASVRLINAELSLLEPWAAGGTRAEVMTERSDELSVRALETDRSRMLIVRRHAPEQQFAPARRATTPVNFVVHGTPITDQAYHLSLNGLQPLWGPQTAGTRITYEDPESVSLVLLTQDPLVMNRVAGDLAGIREQRSRLRHQLATLQLRQTEQVLAQIGESEYEMTLGETRDILERANQLLVSGDFRNAYLETSRAADTITGVRRELWQHAAYTFPAPVSSPLCYSFAALPMHHRATQLLGTGQWSENLLPGGDCEALEPMLRNGWKQHRREETAVETTVELTPFEPAQGRSALRLAARGPDQPSVTLEQGLVWVTAGPVPVRAGQLIRIHGWVKVPHPLRATSDGLMIVDSIAGPPLADRVLKTDGWRRFALYRVAPRDDQLTLTFALTGVGDAWVDEVSVEVHE